MKIENLSVELDQDRLADIRGGITQIVDPYRILDVGSSEVMGVDNADTFGSLDNQPFTPHSWRR